jgi:hypothetical protein
MTRRLGQVGVAVAANVVSVVLLAGPALAQVPDPAADPTMPGAKLLAKVLGWLKYGALGSAVVALLVGGVAVALGHFGQNMGAASAGKKWILGGLGGAALAALANAAAIAVYTNV